MHGRTGSSGPAIWGPRGIGRGPADNPSRAPLREKAGRALRDAAARSNRGKRPKVVVRTVKKLSTAVPSLKAR
jgi:hypothetical protein